MKVRLYCCTHDSGSKEFEDVEVDDETTDDQLEEMAKEFFFSVKEPEYWFIKKEDLEDVEE